MHCESMSVKYRGLHQQQRRERRILAGDALVVLQHSMFYRGQGGSCLLSVAAYHIESYLDVEHILGQLLEREQIHRLRVQSGSDAKKAKSILSNCSVRTLWMKVISSFRVSSCPRDSSSSNSLISSDGKLRSLSTSATSFPLSVPAPTIARR